MIKLGKLTDYAVVIMAQLSNEKEGKSSSANYLSDKTGIPEPTVAKILKKLSHGGMLNSVRGAAGGYKLSRPVNEISVADIICVMEGGIAMVGCACGESRTRRRASKRCFARDKCLVKNSWAIVNAAMVNLLKSITLADMMAVQEEFEGDESTVDVKDPFCCSKALCGNDNPETTDLGEEKIV